jgi:predicted acetyltransferase
MEIRTLRASELDRAFDLDADAFHQAEDKRELWRRFVDPARLVGAFEGERLLAMTHVWEFGQYFGGRPVPMGGVASVAVVPDARGRGLAARVLRRCIEEMRERGERISSLFPATTGLYRSLGWELGGHYAVRQVRARRLRDVPRPERGVLRRLRDEDWPAVQARYRAFAEGANGCLARPAPWWERKRFQWRGRDAYVFEAEGGALEGYLVYRQLDGEYSHLGGDFNIAVEELVATTRDASLGLWRLLGDWASQVDSIHLRGGDDPMLLVMPEQAFEPMAEIRWMTRVIDASGAVAARGFAAGLEVEVPLRLCDPECPANQGDFVLTVQKGRGELSRASRAAGPTLDANGFASLYTGWSGTASLARAGRLQGGSAEQRAALDAAFAGPMPWTLEEF